MKVGRPSMHTPEIEEAILSRMIQGEFVQDICKTEGLPSVVTVMMWRRKRPEFESAYAHARVMQAAEVARQGYERAWNAKDASLDRLAYDAAKWMAGKIDPANFGDKLQHANANGDGDAVTRVEYGWAKPKLEAPLIIDAAPANDAD